MGSLGIKTHRNLKLVIACFFLMQVFLQLSLEAVEVSESEDIVVKKDGTQIKGKILISTERGLLLVTSDEKSGDQQVFVSQKSIQSIKRGPSRGYKSYKTGVDKVRIVIGGADSKSGAIGFKDDKGSGDGEAGYKKIVNAKHKFSMLVPNDYTEMSLNLPNMEMFFANGKLDGNGLQDKEGLMVMSMKMPFSFPETAPDKVVINAFLQGVNQQGTMQADEAKMVTIGDAKVIEVSGTKTIQGEEVKLLSYAFLRPEKVFTFSFVASKNSFDSKQSKFKKIGTTIKFEK